MKKVLEIIGVILLMLLSALSFGLGAAIIVFVICLIMRLFYARNSNDK